jgi:phosphoserine/homoserine phosphotransferase
LEVVDDRIVDYRLRIPDQKRAAVAALRKMNYRVIAGGDSFNDTAMLLEANTGILFHAPENVRREFPQFPARETYAELLAEIRRAMG